MRRAGPLAVRLILCPILALAGFAAAGDEGVKPVQVTDLLRLQQLGDVRVSPDGRQIAYVVRSIVEKEEDDRADRQGRPGKEAGQGKVPLPAWTYRGQVFLAPADGSAPPRQLTRGRASASDPVWRPDGGALAFTREEEGESQVFVLPLGGGEAWPLTRARDGAGEPRWSPDGERILFTSVIPHGEVHRLGAAGAGPEGGGGAAGAQDAQAAASAAEAVPPWPTERPGRPGGDVAEWGDEEAAKTLPAPDPDGDLQAVREWLARGAARDDPKVVHRLDFHGETALEPRRSYAHLFVVDAREGAEARPLTRGFFSFQAGGWTADGRVVAAASLETSKHPDRVDDSELYLIPADGGAGEPELLLDLPGYAVFAPLPSPDGRLVAFLAQELEDRAYGQTELGVVALAGSGAAGGVQAANEARLLTLDFDRSVGQVRWSSDGASLYFVAPSDGGVPLFRVPAAGGEVERLTGLDAGVRSFDAGPGRLAWVETRVADPYELVAAGPDAAGPRRLSAHNAGWLAERTLSFPEARSLTRPDGTRVDYWIMKPVPFEEGKRYPLLIEMHGGPSAMWGPGEATTWHEFQFLAGRGFGIVYANPRGSGGYGYDFEAANYRDWGASPAGDVLAAATEAAKEPWVDPERQVVTGGSYAGYLTAWVVGHDHRFRAAVAQRGVYDLATFLGEGRAWRLVPDHFGGFPWEEEPRAVLRRESPLTYVADVRTPLLILHGDVDLRTGVIQSEVLYMSLKLLEKPVEYVRFPGASHELSRSGDPRQRIDRLLRIYEFFTRWVEPGGR